MGSQEFANMGPGGLRFGTHAKWSRGGRGTGRPPVRGVGGALVSTFGTAERFPDPLFKTPSPLQYDTRYTHPNVVKHTFRSKESPQLMGGGLRNRTQPGFVLSNKDAYIPFFQDAKEAAHGGPQHYHPRYPALVRDTFNAQLRREQDSYHARTTPPQKPLSVPDAPAPFFRNLGKRAGSAPAQRSPAMRMLS